MRPRARAARSRCVARRARVSVDAASARWRTTLPSARDPTSGHRPASRPPGWVAWSCGRRARGVGGLRAGRGHRRSSRWRRRLSACAPGVTARAASARARRADGRRGRLDHGRYQGRAVRAAGPRVRGDRKRASRAWVAAAAPWRARRSEFPLDDALRAWTEEVDTDDARLIAGVLGLHRRSGGDLPSVLDQVVETLRERRAAVREVRALTAQARLSGTILGVLPFGFFAFLWLTSRSDIEGALRIAGRPRGDRARTRAGGSGVPLDPASARGSLTWCPRSLPPSRSRLCGAGIAVTRRCSPIRSLGGTPTVTGRRDGVRSIRPRVRRATRRAARRYRAEVDAEIPQLLDLLAAGSSAGLAAPLALRRAAEGLAGPLADEVRATGSCRRPRRSLARRARRARRTARPSRPEANRRRPHAHRDARLVAGCRPPPSSPRRYDRHAAPPRRNALARHR